MSEEEQDVQLFRNQPLGAGSYGQVCKATFCELPCAAKIIYGILFNDPQSQIIQRGFEQECELLKAIRHPNVVQYLGVTRDPESGLPVLLMELLDENLTHFLERSNEPLPYHLQLSLWYDVALALTFLHSKGIIHRDLSGNNVLLVAGKRAKVTDFGMSKLTVINDSMSRLTRCPGTPFYMSPEALTEPPVYSDKLDVFSSGVVAIQILTRKFPAPGSNMTRQRNTLSPTGFLYIPVPEVQRRKDHIDLIDPRHQLLPVIRSCLIDKDQERPKARQLCRQLAALKESPAYAQSIQQSTISEERVRELEHAVQQLQTEVAENKQATNKIPPHVQKSKEVELREACRLGLLERIPDLLTSVSVDAADSDGNTALYIASRNGHHLIVDELLMRKANMNHQNKAGFTPLWTASHNGHNKVVEILLAAGANPDLKEEGGQSPLWIASHKGHQEVVEHLLAAGANTDLQEKVNGETPLWTASLHGYQKVVKILLAAGANPDLQNKDGWTPLKAASRNGHQSVVELLLAAGANPDLPDKTGATPLWTASFNGHQKVVEILLATGANPDLQDEDRWTPLHIASQNGHNRVIEVLLQAGASVELKTKRGNTPLSIARSKGHEHIVQLLQASRQRTAADRPASVTPATAATTTPPTNTLSRIFKFW